MVSPDQSPRAREAMALAAIRSNGKDPKTGKVASHESILALVPETFRDEARALSYVTRSGEGLAQLLCSASRFDDPKDAIRQLHQSRSSDSPWTLEAIERFVASVEGLSGSRCNVIPNSMIVTLMTPPRDAPPLNPFGEQSFRQRTKKT